MVWITDKVSGELEVVGETVTELFGGRINIIGVVYKKVKCPYFTSVLINLRPTARSFYPLSPSVLRFTGIFKFLKRQLKLQRSRNKDANSLRIELGSHAPKGFRVVWHGACVMIQSKIGRAQTNRAILARCIVGS